MVWEFVLLPLEPQFSGPTLFFPNFFKNAETVTIISDESHTLMIFHIIILRWGHSSTINDFEDVYVYVIPENG
jgi:hypothetical protein